MRLREAHCLGMCSSVVPPEYLFTGIAEVYAVETGVSPEDVKGMLGKPRDQRLRKLEQIDETPGRPDARRRTPVTCPADVGIQGEVSGHVWSRAPNIGMRDVKTAKVLILTDSAGCFYGVHGTYDAESMMRSHGWENIIYEPRPGEGSCHWTEIMNAYLEIHSHLMVSDGAGGWKLPPDFILIVVDNLNNMNWKEKDGRFIIVAVKDEIIGVFGDAACKAMCGWHAPFLICAGSADRWRMSEEFDDVAIRFRAIARTTCGAAAFTGLPFWERLEPFCISSAKGNKDWWHHGVNRAPAGESQPTLANPLLAEWLRFLQPIIWLALLWQPVPAVLMAEAKV